MAENDIIGIGFESSCDETAVAVVKNGSEVLSNEISSQIDIHREYAGVVPEIASRAHLEIVNSLASRALKNAAVSFDDLDYVACTNRPGLTGSLLIGVQSAKSVAYACGIPLVGINHLEAHLYAAFLNQGQPEFPYIGLLVSGGNTVLYRVNGIGDMQRLGGTMDDAAGEAFDKVSAFLGLGYPGGPLIENLAKTATVKKQMFPKILAASNSTFDFSYSGIKTAVVQYVRAHPEIEKAEIAYAFQERALEILSRRVFSAARAHNIKKIVAAGGVVSNGRLRQLLSQNKTDDETILVPPPILCTDNGAMVCGLAYHYFIQGKTDPLTIDVHAKL